MVVPKQERQERERSAASFSTREALVITDDLPAPIPVSCAEVDSVDVHLGHLIQALLEFVQLPEALK